LLVGIRIGDREVPNYSWKGGLRMKAIYDPAYRDLTTFFEYTCTVCSRRARYTRLFPHAEGCVGGGELVILFGLRLARAIIISSVENGDANPHHLPISLIELKEKFPEAYDVAALHLKLYFEGEARSIQELKRKEELRKNFDELDRARGRQPLARQPLHKAEVQRLTTIEQLLANADAEREAKLNKKPNAKETVKDRWPLPQRSANNRGA